MAAPGPSQVTCALRLRWARLTSIVPRRLQPAPRTHAYSIDQHTEAQEMMLPGPQAAGSAVALGSRGPRGRALPPHRWLCHLPQQASGVLMNSLPRAHQSILRPAPASLPCLRDAKELPPNCSQEAPSLSLPPAPSPSARVPWHLCSPSSACLAPEPLTQVMPRSPLEGCTAGLGAQRRDDTGPGEQSRRDGDGPETTAPFQWDS